MERGQFTFYRSYYEAVKELPKKDQVEVMLAICGYALDETEPYLTGTAKAIFSLIRPTLDSSRRKAINGKAGGKSKQTESKTEAKPKQTSSEKENKKEKEKEIEYKNECYITPKPPSGVFEDFAGGDAELLTALKAFEAMRKRIKKPMTEGAKTRLVNKLKQISPDRNAWVAMLHQSEDGCWLNVYEPKGEQKRPNNMVGVNFQPKQDSISRAGDWMAEFLANEGEA